MLVSITVGCFVEESLFPVVLRLGIPFVVVGCSNSDIHSQFRFYADINVKRAKLVATQESKDRPRDHC